MTIMNFTTILLLTYENCGSKRNFKINSNAIFKRETSAAKTENERTIK
jgi:hypothetical protein